MLETGRNSIAIDNAQSVIISRVIDAVTTGTPSTNGLLRTITIGAGSATVLDYPDNLLLYKYKGKVYSIPAYEANTLVYK